MKVDRTCFHGSCDVPLPWKLTYFHELPPTSANFHKKNHATLSDIFFCFHGSDAQASTNFHGSRGICASMEVRTLDSRELPLTSTAFHANSTLFDILFRCVRQHFVRYQGVVVVSRNMLTRVLTLVGELHHCSTHTIAHVRRHRLMRRNRTG